MCVCVCVSTVLCCVYNVSGDLTVRCERCWQLLTFVWQEVPRVWYCASLA